MYTFYYCQASQFQPEGVFLFFIAYLVCNMKSKFLEFNSEGYLINDK